jgi:hypothetical protein
MRRRQIEVIRYRRVTIIGRSDRELYSAAFAHQPETNLTGKKEEDHTFAGEVLDAQKYTRTQRLGISSQRLLNHLLRRRGHYSRK